MTACLQRDVVEVLLESHVETRQVISMACALATRNATEPTRQMAQAIADYVEWVVPLHRADEDVSLLPRLLGRNGTVDSALSTMTRQHVALEAQLSRILLLCRMVGRDVSRLHALRFELEAAADHLRARVTEHQAFEESAVFPALKRLLYQDELESIHGEMERRRANAAGLEVLPPPATPEPIAPVAPPAQSLDDGLPAEPLEWSVGRHVLRN
ncbi:MAG: hemerythrin domain-containing protein [Myxococcaceae bacterium]